MKKSVLVTGAHGFLGRHVARHFSEVGYDVNGIGHGSWGQAEWERCGLTSWCSADITLDALIGYGGKPDIIVHCAGSGSVAFSISYPHHDFNRTVSSTASVLEYIRLYSPNTVMVYPSSAAVYGKVAKLPINENDVLCPISPYGIHKVMAEKLCQLYAQQFNLSCAIVRLFSVYGPGLRKQLLWDACEKFERRENSFFGTGEEIRDWLYVADVANLLFVAAQNATSDCSVVNAGSGQGVSVKEILQCVGNQFDTRMQPGFSSETKAGDPDAYIADISKALACNWKPKMDWRVGVAEYVNWYKQCQ